MSAPDVKAGEHVYVWEYHQEELLLCVARSDSEANGLEGEDVRFIAEITFPNGDEWTAWWDDEEGRWEACEP